jgi:hypothetical protein
MKMTYDKIRSMKDIQFYGTCLGYGETELIREAWGTPNKLYVIIKYKIDRDHQIIELAFKTNSPKG